jgi:RNA polymerase sigma-B factor
MPRTDHQPAGPQVTASAASAHGRGSRAEVAALFERWREHHDERAREALVTRFAPLARSLARRYARSSEPFEDLLQVSMLGLLNAIDRFDPDRGRAFTSFAVPTILGELRRYFRDCGWAVHVPRGRQEQARRVEQASRRITGDRGRPPTVAELAQYLEMTTEDVLGAIQAANAYSTASLDEPRHDREDGQSPSYAETLGELDDGYELVEDRTTIISAAQELPERERLILQLRFARGLTQTEIAQRVGVSQMQVSRLLRRSIARLQASTGAVPEQGAPG